MELTKEVLLSFQGLNGYPGLAHVRVFETTGRNPVVVAGQLTDNPGTMINNGIEMVAESVRRQLFADGREFELVTYHPSSWPYSRVTFNIRSAAEDPFDPDHYTGLTVLTDGMREARVTGGEKAGSFRDPQWRRIDDISAVLGAVPKEWQPDDYTVAGVFGEEGERVRKQITAEAAEQSRQWSSALGDE